MIDRVNYYFRKSYPGRSSILGRLLFRHGESERKIVVQKWFSSMQDLYILDAGCGDGEFLNSILTGRPKKIVIEDLNGTFVSAGYKILEEKADIVESIKCNSFTSKYKNFDLVMAIGVLDYYFNWEDSVKTLIFRSQQFIIFTLPRIDQPRNWVRFFWFYIQGIRLSMVGRRRLEMTISSLGLPFEIAQTHFEWFVCISKNRELI